MKEKVDIKFEQIMAVALLKFDYVDNIDIPLLLDDFKTKNPKLKVEELRYIDQLRDCIHFTKESAVVLNKKITLDTFIENFGCTVEEKILEVAGSVVVNYFNQLDIDQYKKQKADILSKQKERLLNEGIVLLVSDEQKDYDDLKNYGFKNIDHFKSIIRADKYFAEHPEELSKYHIMFRGNQMVQPDYFKTLTNLDKVLWAGFPKLKTSAINVNFFRFDFSEGDQHFDTTLYDLRSGRGYSITESTIFDFFDRLVENSWLNNTLGNIKSQKYIPLQDYINPNKLPLPTKKSDLKILFLPPCRVNDYDREFADQLGVNIDFIEDNNSSFGKYIKDVLGDYDIIIASASYSNCILNMGEESTEQCKDTGRKLTLFVTYDRSGLSIHDEDSTYQCVGARVFISHSYGGELSTSLKRTYRREYSVLCNDSDYEFPNCVRDSRVADRTVIGEAIRLYSEALEKTGNLPIQDCDFTSLEEASQDYRDYVFKEYEKKKKSLQPIKEFDTLTHSIKSYLNYKDRGLLTTIPKELKIVESDNGIYVENLCDGRVLCTLTFSKEQSKDNLRVFSIQTINKKGVLGKTELVGLYTSKFENLPDTPKRPDDKQMSVINAIAKKVNKVVDPLNDEAAKRMIKNRPRRKY